MVEELKTVVSMSGVWLVSSRPNVGAPVEETKPYKVSANLE